MATAALDPQLDTEDGHPDCTGRQLRDFLKASGTSPNRIELVDEMLVKEPATSGKLVVENMIAAKVPSGTIQKAGLYVYGRTFKLATGGASASTEETDRLREQIANMEGYIRGLEQKNAAQTTELIQLRTERTRLIEDANELRRRLQSAETEIARLSDKPPEPSTGGNGAGNGGAAANTVPSAPVQPAAPKRATAPAATAPK